MTERDPEHPPRARPAPRAPAGPPSETKGGGNGRYAVIAAFGVLVSLSVAAVVLLPRWVAERDASTRPESSVQVTESDPPRANAEQAAAAREEAEGALRSYLSARARLELADAATWAAEEWESTAAEIETGDNLFGRRRFAEAAVRYRGALETLERVESERPARLERALAAGAGALAADRIDEARTSFELALAIETENEQAKNGLERALARPGVLKRMGEASAAEASDDPDAALAAYAAALELDGEYDEARIGLARVSAAIGARDYRTAMNRAISALEAGRLDDASAALTDAEKARPGDKAVRDARATVAAKRTRSAVDSLRAKAESHVRAERWSDAIAVYERALDVSRDASFARDGLERARSRLALHAQLDGYLDAPDRLYSAEPLAAAEGLLDGIGNGIAGEPELAKKADRLRGMIAAAAHPVEVTLRSDGATDVVIYRYGTLGRFEEKRIELKPGSYTAVGSRAGYRDVRRELSVRPGAAPAPIVIRCEEPI